MVNSDMDGWVRQNHKKTMKLGLGRTKFGTCCIIAHKSLIFPLTVDSHRVVIQGSGNVLEFVWLDIPCSAMKLLACTQIPDGLTLPLCKDKGLLDLPDYFSHLLLGLSQEIQQPLHPVQSTLHLFQLLPTNSFLPHVLVALFQKPSCLLHAG
jgi:hypothetical protein